MTLRCHARGYPKPTFFWITPEGDFVNATRAIREFEYLDDDSKRVRGKMLQNDGSLLLFNTRVYDSGVYKCVAVNVAGESEGFVNVTVTEGELLVSYRLTVFPFLENFDHRTWGPFLESPETFRANSWRHNSLCIFKTKASRDTKLCIYFKLYSLYNISKDQLYRISGSQFYRWLFGPETFSGLSTNRLLASAVQRFNIAIQ